MDKLKLSRRERALLVIAPLLTIVPFIVKHYMPVSDELYGFFVGACLGIEILLLMRLSSRKKELSRHNL